jgi:hypothetical protein
MSGRCRRRPASAALLLALCLVAVGFHFLGECVTHAAPSPLDSPHPGYDLAEDQFVLASALAPSAEPGSLWGASPLLLPMGLASLPPPVPPPDL